MTCVAELSAHLAATERAVAGMRGELGRLERWGRQIAAHLIAGGRLLAAGNGGSAAQAEHLTGELVGRYRTDRAPLSAVCLHADGTSLTAIANDYGYEEVFARGVRAHGRPGDVLLLLSTSGASRNLIAAADAGREGRLRVLGLTGPAPNPLAERCDEILAVDAEATANVQEAHLVALHLICAVVESAALHAASSVTATAGFPQPVRLGA
jgi:D-sedoheptulose 7-phosphate isomerase